MRHGRTVLWLLVALTGATAGSFTFSATGASALPPEIPERWRGVNTQIDAFTNGPLKLLAETDVNVIRINVKQDVNAAAPTAENPLAPYAGTLVQLDSALPRVREAGIQLIICASEIYGRELDAMWENTGIGQGVRDHLADFWRAFAERYRNEPAIAAYDVFNEPNYPKVQEYLWYGDMLPKAVTAIRSVNPSIWLVVEPGPWGLPGGFAVMPLLNDPYVIYSFHHYAPHRYTHQGIRNYTGLEGTLFYPGVNRMFNTPTNETWWGKAELRESMQKAIDFSRTHNVRMLVGEFSAIRWAPGAAQWLADSIDIFEEEGWDWCYHSIGGWNGWNPTYLSGGAPNDGTTISRAADGGLRTDRWDILQNHWRKNRTE